MLAAKVGKRTMQSVKDVVYLKSIQGGPTIHLQDMHVVSEEDIVGDGGIESTILDLTI